jgi:hypothetical protein
MATMKKRPNPATAAAVFASLCLSLSAPPANAPQTTKETRVEQRSQTQEKPSSSQQTTQNAQQQQQLDDPKRRLHITRQNILRQVKRRMMREGFVLSGRQWRRLMRSARIFQRTGVVS